jgi:L-rhamnose-H+ transport protein
MSDVTVGVVLCLIAGVVNGSFAAPTKYAKHWKWENIWAVWGVVAMFVFPWLLAFLTLPNLMDLYRTAEPKTLLLMIGFGFGFGLAQIFFGLGIAAVGIALNFAIAIGLSTAIGSLVPLVLKQRDMIFTAKGALIIAGVSVILVGIVICAIAGRLKEKQAQQAAPPKRESSAVTMSFKMGLLMTILAGLGSPLINFGLAFGDPLLARAAELGVGPANRANLIWAPLVTASLVPYLAYCIHLWWKNGTWHLYAHPGTGLNWLFGAVMGLLWMGSVWIYGVASARMANMGPILGWPLFMSVIIITSNAWGFLTGEWRGAGRKPLLTMVVGILFLILGFCTLAFGSRLE